MSSHSLDHGNLAAAQSAPDEREAFEACMRIGGYSNPGKHPDGSYVSSAMELWWQGWKARAAWKRAQSAPVVPEVQVTGHLDEVDAPVWEFINAEARKLGPITGSIDTYGLSRQNGAQTNGGVVVLWNGQKIHALAVTVRDAMNRTQCVRMLSAAPAHPAPRNEQADGGVKS